MARRVVVITDSQADDFGVIGRALDSGILGVIVPMVNSPAEARAAAYAMRYPPRGGRSTADNLAVNLGADYHSWADDEVFLAVRFRTVVAGRRPRVDVREAETLPHAQQLCGLARPVLLALCGHAAILSDAGGQRGSATSMSCGPVTAAVSAGSSSARVVGAT